MSKRKTPRGSTPRKYQAPLPKTSNAAAPPRQRADPWKEWALLALFWSYVLIPMAWGVASTAKKALLLFK